MLRHPRNGKEIQATNHFLLLSSGQILADDFSSPQIGKTKAILPQREVLASVITGGIGRKNIPVCTDNVTNERSLIQKHLLLLFYTCLRTYSSIQHILLHTSFRFQKYVFKKFCNTSIPLLYFDI